MAEYIEREALLAKVRPDDTNDKYKAVLISDVKKMVRNLVNSVPAADVAPVWHGKWLPFRVGFWTSVFECSECHRRIEVSCDEVRTLEMLIIRYPFCNCGAKMDMEVMDNGQK